MRKAAAVIALIIFLIVSLAVFWSYFQFLGPVKDQTRERFVVGLKSTEKEIVADLKEKGFIKNYRIFDLILSFKNWHGKIEPGAYLVSKGMNAYELAGTLIYGPFQKWVLIPPGKRKEQTALILKNGLNWPEHMVATFIQVAQEGYLSPDTYLIDTDSDPQQVFQKLKNNFQEKFGSQLQEGLLDKNIRQDTAIKIASLIERESGSDEDKPIIAGIIWNRLEKGMRLEIDATVQYALTNQNINSQGFQSDDFNFWPKVTAKDLRITISSYNTYLNKGLPPGPICTPSLASIKAVVYPGETDALYYLHSPDKQIHTAKTYKEHQQNIEKYLK